MSDVEKRAARRATALDLKYAVTDLNGWQTAYGYDDGASRPQFEASRVGRQRQLAAARRELTDPQERAQLARLDAGLRGFLALDDVAYAALRRGRTERVRQIFLGPEITRFQAMAGAAAALASYEARQAAVTQRDAERERRDARRRLVAVGLGAGGPHRAAPPDRPGRRPRRAGAARRRGAEPAPATGSGTPPDQA